MVPLRCALSWGGEEEILTQLDGVTNLVVLTNLTVLGIGPLLQWFHEPERQW